IEAGDDLNSIVLEPGLHLIANAALNDPSDGRIARVRRELIRENPPDIEGWFREAARLCALPAQNGQPAICLVGADRGTVSSSILGLAGDLSQSRFWHAPGPPDRAAYDDVSGELRSLFAVAPFPDIEPPENSPARRAVRENVQSAVLQTA